MDRLELITELIQIQHTELGKEVMLWGQHWHLKDEKPFKRWNHFKSYPDPDE